MLRHSLPQGFTRKELLVTLGLVLGVGFVASSSMGGSGPGPEQGVKAATIQAQEIHTALAAWAKDHNEAFPHADQSSNEAFRELFKAGLVTQEKTFAIPGDAWHKKSPSGDGKGPDNLIGTAPDFPQALQPGECAFAYVSGLTQKSDPSLPIIANAFTESPGAYTNNPSHKGGVFKGEKCVWVSVSGSATTADLSPGYRLLQNKNGKMIDFFTEEGGTNPDNIKNPFG
jgi:hypothetical protein